MSEDQIARSINKLDEWITANNWKAYDPFDGLSAHLFGLHKIRNHYLRIVLQQSVRRLPINVRPALGIRPQTSSKGMGFCALGYLYLYQATRSEMYVDKLKHCLDWLKQNYSRDFSGRSWGNHFNYESRGGEIKVGVPTIVWSSWIGNAFLEAGEELAETEYLQIAEQVGKFIVRDISRFDDSDGTCCFMYTPIEKENLFGHCVHNSNVLGGWLLARLFKLSGDEQLLELAKRSVAYTANRQLETGAWYYGEADKFHWIDNFHTGYVLESLHGYAQATNDHSFDEVLVKGFRYFKTNFFEEDGTPRYYDHKIYPIDIQCASQGIQTLVNLRQYDDSSLQLAEKVAAWTIENMQNSDGFFYFRKYPFAVNKTPMFHWGQATMLAALAALLKAQRM